MLNGQLHIRMCDDAFVRFEHIHRLVDACLIRSYPRNTARVWTGATRQWRLRFVQIETGRSVSKTVSTVNEKLAYESFSDLSSFTKIWAKSKYLRSTWKQLKCRRSKRLRNSKAGAMFKPKSAISCFTNNRRPVSAFSISSRQVSKCVAKVRSLQVQMHG